MMRAVMKKEARWFLCERARRAGVELRKAKTKYGPLSANLSGESRGRVWVRRHAPASLTTSQTLLGKGRASPRYLLASFRLRAALLAKPR